MLENNVTRLVLFLAGLLVLVGFFNGFSFADLPNALTTMFDQRHQKM